MVQLRTLVEDKKKYFWLEVQDHPSNCHLIKIEGSQLLFLCSGSTQMVENKLNEVNSDGLCSACVIKANRMGILSYFEDDNQIRDQYEYWGKIPNHDVLRKSTWEIEVKDDNN